jgi:CheY-like chemotaxis protein
MADDDEDDRIFAREALDESRLRNDLHFVEDGEMLLEYLNRSGSYSHLKGTPLPGLLLLDLNMPRMDGREALREIRKNPDLRCLPIVILTTSDSEEDIIRSYNLGANSFIRKPVTFEGLVSLMSALGQYWFEIVELPTRSNG